VPIHATATSPATVTAPDARDLRTAVDTRNVNEELEPIPSAIRPVIEPPRRMRMDARLAFGIAMAVIGLLVVLYAVISLLR
jgi:hypothetical protein